MWTSKSLDGSLTAEAEGCQWPIEEVRGRGIGSRYN